MLLALLAGPDADAAAAPPPTQAGTTCSARNGRSPRHALQAGFTVMLVPLVWRWLELPNLAQTAITVAAVMAVPALSADAAKDQQKITERAMHRLLGCLLGGIAGLGCLAVSVENFRCHGC